MKETSKAARNGNNGIYTCNGVIENPGVYVEYRFTNIWPLVKIMRVLFFLLIPVALYILYLVLTQVNYIN